VTKLRVAYHRVVLVPLFLLLQYINDIDEVVVSKMF
jgi:hypothetical protein